MVKIRQESVVLLEKIFHVPTVILYIWIKVRNPRKEDDEDEEDEKMISSVYDKRADDLLRDISKKKYR